MSKSVGEWSEGFSSVANVFLFWDKALPSMLTARLGWQNLERNLRVKGLSFIQ